MVIYEVNLTVNNSIFQEYYDWLVNHMTDMLEFRGFIKAEISKEHLVHNETAATHLIVQYTVESEADLDDYLNHHAAKMRAESVKKFGDQFKATRRVYSRAFITSQDV